MSIIDKKEHLPDKNDRIVGGVLGAVIGPVGAVIVLFLFAAMGEVLDMELLGEPKNPFGAILMGAAAGGFVVGLYFGAKHIAYMRIPMAPGEDWKK